MANTPYLLYGVLPFPVPCVQSLILLLPFPWHSQHESQVINQRRSCTRPIRTVPHVRLELFSRAPYDEGHFVLDRTFFYIASQFSAVSALHMHVIRLLIPCTVLYVFIANPQIKKASRSSLGSDRMKWQIFCYTKKNSRSAFNKRSLTLIRSIIYLLVTHQSFPREK
jgi:hypothetical protein